VRTVKKEKLKCIVQNVRMPLVARVWHCVRHVPRRSIEVLPEETINYKVKQKFIKMRSTTYFKINVASVKKNSKISSSQTLIKCFLGDLKINVSRVKQSSQTSFSQTLINCFL
jgi:hypothetical protein